MVLVFSPSMVTPLLTRAAYAPPCNTAARRPVQFGPGSRRPPPVSVAGPRSILRSKTGNPFVERDATGCTDGSPLLKAALDSSAEGGHHR